MGHPHLIGSSSVAIFHGESPKSLPNEALVSLEEESTYIMSLEPELIAKINPPQYPRPELSSRRYLSPPKYVSPGI